MKNKGITLVALVITIIILLILAGITIASLTGSGLFEKTQEAKIQYEKEQAKEELTLAIYSIQANNVGNLNMNTIIEKLPQEKNLDLDKLELDSTQEGQVLTGVYKGYSFSINSNYEVVLGDEVIPSDDEEIYSKKTQIFYQGENYSDVTGGWDVYVNTQFYTNTLENTSYTTSYGEYNIGTDSLDISVIPVSYNDIGSLVDFKTRNKIDMSYYDKIGILGTTQDMTDFQMIGVTNSSTYSDTRYLENTITFVNNQITYLDISELTGEYYIQFGMGSYFNGAAQIQEVWLEKKDVYATIEVNNDLVEKGQNIIANVNLICTVDEINLQKSKYILSTQSDKYGIESQEWNSAQSFSKSNQNLNISTQGTGTYYLHVLTVDNSGNMYETISNPINVVQFLYSGNDDYSDITGGWNFYVNSQLQTSTINNNSYLATYGEYSIQEEYLDVSIIPVLYNSTGSYTDFKTINKIDLTNYNKIGILASTEEVTDFQSIGVTNNDTYTVVTSLTNVRFVNNQATYLDVSGLSGEYYIQFGMGSYLNGKGKIYKIWAE